MSTFLEDDNNENKKALPPALTQQQQQQQEIAKISTNTPFSQFVAGLNQSYQEKVKKWAQLSSYNITVYNGDNTSKKVIYKRMKLRQWQFDEVEDLRAMATELAVKSPVEAQKAIKTMYSNAATYLLFNTETNRPMTQEEYKNADFPEVRPAIDSSLLLSLVSDPN